MCYFKSGHDELRTCMNSRRRPGCQVSLGLALMVSACGLVMQSSGSSAGTVGSRGLGMEHARSICMGEHAEWACSGLLIWQLSSSAASMNSFSRQRLAPAHGMSFDSHNITGAGEHYGCYTMHGAKSGTPTVTLPDDGMCFIPGAGCCA